MNRRRENSLISAGALITIDGKNIDDAENEEDYVNLSSYFFDNIVQSPEDGKAVNLDGTPFTEDQEISYVLEDGSMEYNIILFNAESEDYFMEKTHPSGADRTRWSVSGWIQTKYRRDLEL